MSSVFTLNGICWWYWAVALLITVYQACRGYRFQWLFGIDSARRIAAETAAAQQTQLAQQPQAGAQQPQAAQQPQIPHLGIWDRRILLSFADFLTYAVCALSGFYALLIAYRAAGLTPVTKAPLQHPSVLIFLVLYGILGITGKLPDTLDRIKGGLEWKP